MPREESGGRLPGRRDAIKMGARGALSTVGIFALAGISHEDPVLALGPNTVVLTPEMTEGPFFVEENLNRSDIRIDPADKSIQIGHPLGLKVTVSQLKKGVLSAVSGAHVDIWHCSATGAYSDVPMNRTQGKKFLRGYQVSDKDGNAAFTTVYPGWYFGRTVHIHAKVRLFAGEKTTYEFTTQFFFDDKLTDRIFAAAPYNRRGVREMRNDQDGIFVGMGGRGGRGTDGALVTLKAADDGSRTNGAINLVLDLSQSHTGRGRGQGGFGPPGGTGGPGGFGPPPGGFGPPPGPPPFGPGGP